jgi:hypothetical protein
MRKWLDSIRRYRFYRDSSLLAPVINLVFIQALILIIGYLWFVQRTKIPLLSLILTLIISGLLTLAFLLQERKSFLKKKAQTRRNIGRDYLSNKIRQLNQDEFKWQIAQLLLKIEGIGDIQEGEHFLETTLHGRKTAIGIYHTDYEDEVPISKLADFLNKAGQEGYFQALFIASGSFTDSCKALVDKKSTLKVQLLDMEDLLNRMEHTGMFPDEKTIDSLVDKEIQRRKQKLQVLKKEILMPRRIRTYLAYSLLFFVLSRLFNNLYVYYVFISVIFLLLSAFTWFLNLRNKTHPQEGESLLDPPAAGYHQGS